MGGRPRAGGTPGVPISGGLAAGFDAETTTGNVPVTTGIDLVLTEVVAPLYGVGLLATTAPDDPPEEVWGSAGATVPTGELWRVDRVEMTFGGLMWINGFGGADGLGGWGISTRDDIPATIDALLASNDFRVPFMQQDLNTDGMVNTTGALPFWLTPGERLMWNAFRTGAADTPPAKVWGWRGARYQQVPV
jgi:hypothetical protein